MVFTTAPTFIRSTPGTHPPNCFGLWENVWKWFGANRTTWWGVTVVLSPSNEILIKVPFPRIFDFTFLEVVGGGKE